MTRRGPAARPGAWPSRTPATTREAKALVSRLIDEMGFDPIDTGSLVEGGRRQQPGSPCSTGRLPQMRHGQRSWRSHVIPEEHESRSLQSGRPPEVDQVVCDCGYHTPDRHPQSLSLPRPPLTQADSPPLSKLGSRPSAQTPRSPCSRRNCATRALVPSSGQVQ